MKSKTTYVYIAKKNIELREIRNPLVNLSTSTQVVFVRDHGPDFPYPWMVHQIPVGVGQTPALPAEQLEVAEEGSEEEVVVDASPPVEEGDLEVEVSTVQLARVPTQLWRRAAPILLVALEERWAVAEVGSIQMEAGLGEEAELKALSLPIDLSIQASEAEQERKADELHQMAALLL